MRVMLSIARRWRVQSRQVPLRFLLTTILRIKVITIGQILSIDIFIALQSLLHWLVQSLLFLLEEVVGWIILASLQRLIQTRVTTMPFEFIVIPFSFVSWYAIWISSFLIWFLIKILPFVYCGEIWFPSIFSQAHPLFVWSKSWSFLAVSRFILAWLFSIQSMIVSTCPCIFVLLSRAWVSRLLR